MFSVSFPIIPKQFPEPLEIIVNIIDETKLSHCHLRAEQTEDSILLCPSEDEASHRPLLCPPTIPHLSRCHLDTRETERYPKSIFNLYISLTVMKLIPSSLGDCGQVKEPQGQQGEE